MIWVSRRHCISLFLSTVYFLRTRTCFYVTTVKVPKPGNLMLLHSHQLYLVWTFCLCPGKRLIAGPLAVGAEWWSEEKAVWRLRLGWLRPRGRQRRAELLARRPHCGPRGALQEDIWGVLVIVFWRFPECIQSASGGKLLVCRVIQIVAAKCDVDRFDRFLFLKEKGRATSMEWSGCSHFVRK